MFSGNFGNLGHDLNPSNIFSDFGKDASKAFSNPLFDVGLAGTLLTAGVLGPELLGGSLLPTVGEAAGGLSGAAGLSAEAPASLGAAFGGAGLDTTLTGADALTGTQVLAQSAEPIVSDPIAQAIPGLEGSGQGFAAAAPINPSGAFGMGQAFVGNPIASDFEAIGPGDQLLRGMGGGAFGDASSFTGNPIAMGYTNAVPDASGGVFNYGGISPGAVDPNSFVPDLGGEGQAVPVTGAQVSNAAAGGGTQVSASGGTPPPQGFADAFKAQFSGTNIGSNLGKGLANPFTDIGLGLGVYNVAQGIRDRNQFNQLQQQEATAAGNAALAAKQIQAAVMPMINNGELLQQYLTTGTLPPEFQQQVKQTVDAMKAQIIQGYAARGMSTNPQQNSALAQDLNNADAQAQTLQANLESTLFNAGNQMTQQANALFASGLNATQLSSEIPIAMQALKTQEANEISKSLAVFAAALPGASGSQKFTISPATG